MKITKYRRKRKECCDWRQIQNRILDDIFDIASDIHGWNVNELATRSGLAWNTVENLNSNVTKFPQFRTIILLAKAVGMNVSVISEEIKRAKAA